MSRSGRGRAGHSPRVQHRAAAASYQSSSKYGASRSSAVWGARGAAAAYGRSGTKRAAAAGAYKSVRAHGGTKIQAKAAARGAAAAVSDSASTTYAHSSGYNVAAAMCSRPKGQSYSQTQAEESQNWLLRSSSFYFDSPYYVGSNWREQYETHQNDDSETSNDLRDGSMLQKLSPSSSKVKEMDPHVSIVLLSSIGALILAVSLFCLL